jgi:hypothetical protein
MVENQITTYFGSAAGKNMIEERWGESDSSITRNPHAGWFTFGSARKPNGQFGRSSFSGLRLEEPPNEYLNEAVA